MTLTCHDLLTRHAEVWRAATVHPFLQQCQAGTIQPVQFHTWLVQDYLFVLECTRLAARLLSEAPPEHFDVILGGLGALKDELRWFQANAAKRGLNLQTPPQPTCVEYCAMMADLRTRPYTLQAVGFWAIECAYNQAWRGHSPMPEPYTEFGDRWGNAGFTEYVGQLARQADEALHIASAEIEAQASDLVLTVAHLEKAFWQMAFAAT